MSPDLNHHLETLIRPALPHTGPAPTRAHQFDAGLDLTATADTWIQPGTITAIGTGIAVAIPPGTVGIIAGRSGLAARDSVILANGIGVIDAGYRGEIRVLLTKISDDPDDWTKIRAGDRIAQLLVLPALLAEPVAVTQLPTCPDGRGTGGFGSTGRRA